MEAHTRVRPPPRSSRRYNTDTAGPSLYSSLSSDPLSRSQSTPKPDMPTPSLYSSDAGSRAQPHPHRAPNMDVATWPQNQQQGDDDMRSSKASLHARNTSSNRDRWTSRSASGGSNYPMYVDEHRYSSHSHEPKTCASCSSPADPCASECQICGDPFPAPPPRVNLHMPPKVQVVPLSSVEREPMVWMSRGFSIRTPSGPRAVQLPVLAKSSYDRGAPFPYASYHSHSLTPSNDDDHEMEGRWL